MVGRRQISRAKSLCRQVDADSQTHFYRTSLSYAFLSGFAALWLAYWPAATGDVLAKLRVIPADFTSAAQTPDRAHKADRLPVISFEQRWSAVPAQSHPIDSGRAKQPQAQGRIEKIPFSCELAFSRVVTKGNFSTRCMARADEVEPVALG